MERDPMNNREWQQAMDAAAKLLDNETARRAGERGAVRGDHRAGEAVRLQGKDWRDGDVSAKYKDLTLTLEGWK